MTKYDWSVIFRNIQSAFFTLFLILIIGGIIVQSNNHVRWIFRSRWAFPLQLGIRTVLIKKIIIIIITRNYNLSKYIYKIPLNNIYWDLIYCPNTVLHEIYHYKCSFYEFQIFIKETILFNPCWKNAFFRLLHRCIN